MAFDIWYLIKSISAVSNYNSSSCLLMNWWMINSSINESSVSRTAHLPLKIQAISWEFEQTLMTYLEWVKEICIPLLKALFSEFIQISAHNLHFISGVY